MKKFLVLVFLALTGVSPASAAILNIRSGEHSDFSRLVIDIPVGGNWSVGKADNGYSVKVLGAEGFDISEIFNRIPKNRILDVTSQGQTINLELVNPCPCRVRSFLWQPGKLVVDVIDGAEPVAETSREVFSKSLPLVTPRLERSAGLLDIKLPPQNIFSERNGTDQFSDLEDVVVMGIARGASQGLLTPSKKLSKTDASLRQSVDSSKIVSGQNPLGILAHTSFDMRLITNADEKNPNQAGCLPSEYFSISKWSPTDDYSEAMSVFQHDLTNSLFETDFDDINRLAKGYLFFGFGREASLIMTSDGNMSQERKVLDAMAKIIDGEKPGSNVLVGEFTCDGDGSLWGLLASEDVSNKVIDARSILLAFKRLPKVLQVHLAPRVSDKFLQIGDTESANIALVSVGDGVGTTIESKLTSIALSAKQGKASSAAERLAIAASADTRMNAEGLIAYFEAAIVAGKVIGDSDIELADILRFENKDQEILKNLIVAEVNALLTTDNAERAFQVIAEESDFLSTDDRRKLNSQVMMDVIDTLSDDKFLEIAFSTLVDDFDPYAQNTVAKRLLGLGLPERASHLLQGEVSGVAAEERENLNAQAALEMGGTQLVETFLSRLNDSQGETILTSEEVTPDGNGMIGGGLSNSDWRDGSWDTLSKGQDLLLKELSLSILDITPPQEDESSPLNAGKKLIEDSKKTRELMDQVMARYGLVADPL